MRYALEEPDKRGPGWIAMICIFCVVIVGGIGVAIFCVCRKRGNDNVNNEEHDPENPNTSAEPKVHEDSPQDPANKSSVDPDGAPNDAHAEATDATAGVVVHD